MTRLSNMGREQRGGAVIELALIAPVLAFLVVGVVDMSLAVGRKLAIEQAAQRAIEKVAQTTGEETPADTIKREAVCQINGTNADNTCKTGRLTTDNVTVTFNLKCDGVATDFTLDCAEGQSEVRYIMAKIADKYEPLFPIKFAGLDADGTYHLAATAGVRVK